MASRNGRESRLAVYHDGRGSEPVIVVGSISSFVALSMVSPLLYSPAVLYGAWNDRRAGARRRPRGVARGSCRRAVAPERSRLLAALDRVVGSRRLLPLRQSHVERDAVPARHSRSA